MNKDAILSRAEFCDLLYDVIDTIHEGMQIINREGYYLYVNKAAASHGKNNPTDLIGKKMTEVYPGITDTKMYQTMMESIDSQKRTNMLNKFTFPDGSTGWFRLSFEPIPQGILILSIDITDMQEKILRQEEEDLHRTKASMGVKKER